MIGYAKLVNVLAGRIVAALWLAAFSDWFGVARIANSSVLAVKLYYISEYLK